MKMKRINTILASLLFFLAALPAHAAGADGVGNGGDAVTCRRSNGSIQSIELLDFYEARIMRGIQHDLGADNLNVEEKIGIAIERIRKFAPDWAAKYEEYAKDFFSNTTFLTGTALVDIPDSQHLALPVGCAIEQIAIQRNPQFSEDKRYVVNKDLWDALDSTNKAGLVLHEITHRQALEWAHKNSISTRYFNSYIASNKLNDMRSDQFLKVLTELPFYPNIEIRGIALNLKMGVIQFHSNGMLKSAFVAEGAKAFLFDRFVPVERQVLFHDNGELESVSLVANHKFPIQGRDVFVERLIEFHPNKTLARIDLLHDTVLEVNNLGVAFMSSRFGSEVRFHDNGVLYSGTTTSAPLTSPRYVLIPTYRSSVKYYPNGILSSFCTQRGGIVVVQGQRLAFGAEGQDNECLKFHENGVLAKAIYYDGASSKLNFWGHLVKPAIGTFELFADENIKTIRAAEPLAIQVRGMTFNVAGELKATESGQLLSAYSLVNDRIYQYALDGEILHIHGREAYRYRNGGNRDKSYEGISFYEDGTLRSALLDKAAVLRNTNGHRVAVADCTAIELNAEGRLLYSEKMDDCPAPVPRRRGN